MTQPVGPRGPYGAETPTRDTLRDGICRLAWSFFCSSEPTTPDVDAGWTRAKDLLKSGKGTDDFQKYFGRVFDFAETVISLCKAHPDTAETPAVSTTAETVGQKPVWRCYRGDGSFIYTDNNIRAHPFDWVKVERVDENGICLSKSPDQQPQEDLTARGDPQAWLMRWKDGGICCVTLNREEARAGGESELIAEPLYPDQSALIAKLQAELAEAQEINAALIDNFANACLKVRAAREIIRPFANFAQYISPDIANAVNLWPGAAYPERAIANAGEFRRAASFMKGAE